jgi:hypothetical protein
MFLKPSAALSGLIRRVTVSPEGTDSLINTIKLGVHLFNPHRFHGVLKNLDALKSIPARSNRTVDISEDVASYLTAGDRCFRNSLNVKLLSAESVVGCLKLLQSDFSHFPIYNTLIAATIESIDSESRLVAFIHWIERFQLSDHELMKGLRNKLDLVETIKSRVKVAHLAEDPKGYLSDILDMSGKRLMARAQLNEIDFATIVRLTGDADGKFGDCIEFLLNHRLRTLGTNDTEKVKFLNFVIHIAQRIGTPDEYLGKFVLDNLRPQVELLSVCQTVNTWQHSIATESCR